MFRTAARPRKWPWWRQRLFLFNLILDNLDEAGLSMTHYWPRKQDLTCTNTCCADRWVVEQWSACSKTCGKLGYQTRVVQCMQAQNNGTNKPVHSKHCTGDRPDTRRACNQTLCPAQWRTGAWSQVSTHVGPWLATILLIVLMLNKHYFPLILFRNLIRIQLLIQNFGKTFLKIQWSWFT